MNVTLIQTALHWEDPKANRSSLSEVIRKVGNTDIIVLPEMFSTAFSNRSSELADSMDGITVQWMKEMAKSRKAVITGSVIISEGGQYFNRMLWVQPDGKISYYNKRHLFRMAGEHEHFEAGKERVIVTYKGWRIMLQVCYDLRFPVFARNQYIDGRYEYDLLIYVANWPSPRHNAWEGLLRARAMENLSYCIGVNRVGKDGNGLAYKGGSVVLDYLGKSLVVGDDQARLLNQDLDLDALRQFREKFPTGMDADPFTFMA